jgi:hypothetical protein
MSSVVVSGVRWVMSSLSFAARIASFVVGFGAKKSSSAGAWATSRVDVSKVQTVDFLQIEVSIVDHQSMRHETLVNDNAHRVIIEELCKFYASCQGIS